MEKLLGIEWNLVKMYDMHFMRLAMIEGLSLDRTMKALVDYKYIIVAEENTRSGKIHQHLLVSDKVHIDDIKKKLVDEYGPIKGNKQWAITNVKDKSPQIFKYIVKDGNFRYKGFSKTLMDAAVKCSSHKGDVKKEFADLEDAVKLGQISFDMFMERNIELRIKHDQNLYTQHIVAYFRKIAIKTGELKVSEYCRNLNEQIYR